MLNSTLIAAIACLGHGQYVVIADAGLPIPGGVQLIDLALVPGVPGFADTVRAILHEGVFEEAVTADEFADSMTLRSLAPELSRLRAVTVTHREFKARLRHAAAIVRTGEFTPYANIALTAGVPF